MARYGFEVDVSVPMDSTEHMHDLFTRLADQLFDREDIEDADVAGDLSRQVMTLSMVVPEAGNGEDAFAHGCRVIRDVAEAAGVDLLDSGTWMLTARVDALSSHEEQGKALTAATERVQQA